MTASECLWNALDMLQKIRLSQGPLHSRLALVWGLRPHVWFRFTDSEAIDQRVAYRASGPNSREYVFDTSEAATGDSPPTLPKDMGTDSVDTASGSSAA